MIYSYFKWCSTKTNFPFVFLPQYVAPSFDNLIKVLPTPLKAKSTMDESLCFSLSWGNFVYNVKKSNVATIDLTGFFYLCYWVIEWWGKDFLRP